MKTPLGREVDLGPIHIVLDGDPVPLRNGQSSPLLSVHVYSGHSCPSQLLLSCCWHCSLAKSGELTDVIHLLYLFLYFGFYFADKM